MDIINIILTNSVASYREIIGDIQFVDKNPCKITIDEVKKVNSIVTRFKKIHNYSLHPVREKFNEYNEMEIVKRFSKDLNLCFIDAIGNNSDVKKVRYFHRGLLKYFKSRNPQLLINEIGNYNNWIITSKKIAEDISKIQKFTKSDDFEKSIYLYGKVGNINIFATELTTDVIYSGNSELVNGVFLNTIKAKKSKKSWEIEVDYLFTTKAIKKIILC